MNEKHWLSDLFADLEHDCEIYQHMADTTNQYLHTMEAINEEEERISAWINEGTPEGLDNAQVYLNKKVNDFLKLIDNLADSALEQEEKAV